jgi:hypothetical protein
MTDDEINARVESLLSLPEDEQALAILAPFESLPPERQHVVREFMRSMLGIGLKG